MLDLVGPPGGAGPADPPGVAPEFRDLPEGVLDLWLAIAAAYIENGGVWGERLSHVHALIAAHLLATVVGADGLGGSEDGAIASESLGPASVSYVASTSSAMTTGLSTSIYGRTYEALRSTIRHRTSWIVGNPYAATGRLLAMESYARRGRR